MNEEHDIIESTSEPAPEAAAPRVRTLLLCDLADSTALVERLGDTAAAELIRRHDRLARDLLHQHRGREIDKTDGFLALFERPVEAVAFALAYQRTLRQLSGEAKQTLASRVGIHVGEVVVWENSLREVADGAKRLDVEGLAKPVAARLMNLALPGQILLSGIAFSLAQRAAPELSEQAQLRWLTHGRYRFKGVAAPMLVHEVGEAGSAPLHAPPSSSKAQREVPLWRRPGVIALEAVALMIAIAVPIALTLRATPAIAFGERDWIVVGELRNLTGETLLDDSLETAFRISLEQSRYVNVLSDLKLRDALARMQKPADTDIDRAVASEIALREGARAVILPTVAEIGGRVRVSAEVIDPHTQTTVYAESADGVGAPSTLDSIDRVTHELRAKLGEALSNIEKDSAPLPKVASANLAALRAYALGLRAYYDEDRFDRALQLFQQALDLDPEFAQVKIAIGNVHLAGDDLPNARRLFEEAVAGHDRLTQQGQLMAQANAATLSYRADAPARWRNLIDLFPDYDPPYYNSVLFEWERANRFASGVEVARPADRQTNAARASLWKLFGTLELGLERYDAARRRFADAEKLRPGGGGEMLYAALAGAERDPLTALRHLETWAPSGLPANDVFWQLHRATLAADGGDLGAADQFLAEGQRRAEAFSANHAAVFAAARLALCEVARAAEECLTELRRVVDFERGPEAMDLAERPHAAFRLALASAVAVRANVPELAENALTRARAALGELSFPIVSQWLDAAEAQRRLSAGDPSDGIEIAQREGDASLLLVRSLQIEALAAAGDLREALAAAERLATARGRAYTELGSLATLEPRNVVETNLARLRAAELAARLGDRAATLRWLQEFERIWPEDVRPPRIAQRVAALRSTEPPAAAP